LTSKKEGSKRKEIDGKKKKREVLLATGENGLSVPHGGKKREEGDPRVVFPV